ncbi:MAG: HDOD domain-containing protein [Thermodesulfobacteriota bacterium]|nr:HDOD domain-containing protein [Thermodesulfobacteriota bacterium]
MDREKLHERIYSKIDELPTLPAVVPKILGLIGDEKSSAADFTDTISKDLALTSKILKVANSAYYGFPQQISRLEHAVALLGSNMVKSLALSIGIIRTFSSHKRSPYFSVKGLWLHSLSVAMLMEELGRRLGKRKDNESLFIVGLLHDIGKVVLDQFFNDLFQQVLEEVNTQKGIKLHIAEQKVIGIDHCELAGILLTRWKFPNNIIHSITFHHHIHESEVANPDNVVILRISNIVAQQLGLGEEGNPTANEVHESDLERLNMSDKDFDDLKAYSQDIKHEVEALFSAIV